MKKYTDEEIQEWLENGMLPEGKSEPPAREDIALYQQLFQLLGQEPSVTLPADFSSRVVASLQPARRKSGEAVFNYLMAACIVLFFTGMFFILAFMNNDTINQLFGVLVKYKWVCLFGITFIVLLNFFDQKFTRQRLAL